MRRWLTPPRQSFIPRRLHTITAVIPGIMGHRSLLRRHSGSAGVGAAGMGMAGTVDITAAGTAAVGGMVVVVVGGMAAADTTKTA